MSSALEYAAKQAGQAMEPPSELHGCPGIISVVTAACTNFKDLVACRFLLSVAEAAYFLGYLYLLSGWYTRKELTKRTAFLYSGSVLSGAFSGLIAAGITKNLGGKRRISAWRWLFIIEGVVTVSDQSVCNWLWPSLISCSRFLLQPSPFSSFLIFLVPHVDSTRKNVH